MVDIRIDAADQDWRGMVFFGKKADASLPDVRLRWWYANPDGSVAERLQVGMSGAQAADLRDVLGTMLAEEEARLGG